MKPNGLLIISCVGLATLLLFLRGADYDKSNPLDLTKAQVEQFEAKTKADDYGACLRLSDYFCLVKEDPKTAAHWWEVLVNLGNVEAIVEVGNCLMYAGDFDAAEKWMLRGKENGDLFADDCLKDLAKRRAEAGQGGGAKKTKAATDAAPATGPAEAGAPTDAAGYNERAKARFEKGNFPGVIADTDRAIELDPKNAAAYFQRAEAKAYEGSLDAAIADYTRAIELDPTNAMAYCRRGFTKGTKSDMEGLLADENRAVELDPKNPNAYCFRGIARAEKGDLEGAIADDTRAIELAPKYATAYNDRGLARARQGDREGAIADCSQAIALRPKYAAYYDNRGVVETLTRDWKGALADYRKACEVSRSGPQQDYPHLFIWLNRARLNDTEAASQELFEYLGKRPKTSSGDWVSQVGEFLLGKTDEATFFAAADSPDAKKQNGQRCEAWYYRGMKKLLAGDHAPAAECFRKCLGTEQTRFTEYQLAEAELKTLQP